MRCFCPDDCNCRHPHRMNFCGCRCWETPDPEPQGEAVRLFTPAPAQIPAQTYMDATGQTIDASTGDVVMHRAFGIAAPAPIIVEIPVSRENPGT